MSECTCNLLEHLNKEDHTFKCGNCIEKIISDSLDKVECIPIARTTINHMAFHKMIADISLLVDDLIFEQQRNQETFNVKRKATHKSIKDLIMCTVKPEINEHQKVSYE